MPIDLPTITRGRLTCPSTGISRTFLFNPTKISAAKATNWGTLEVPGASHPVYQFGSGGERLISFEIYLDADSGYQRLTDKSNGMDLSDEIAYYESLVYPSQVDGTGFTSVYPYTQVFSMGKLFSSVNCIVKDVGPVEYSFFRPDMTPMRATIPMKLAEIVQQSRTSDDIRLRRYTR